MYGSEEWHRKDKRRQCRVPLPVYGYRNGRSMYVDITTSDKGIDSSVLNQSHFKESHSNARLTMSPEQEGKPPYPLNLHQELQHGHRNMGWPRIVNDPELFPATANPLRMDSTQVAEIPRGEPSSRPYPANAIDWTPTQQYERNRAVLPGMQPRDAGGMDSSIVVKYGVGYHDLNTRHPDDKGTRGGLSISSHGAAKAMKKQMKKLYKLTPPDYGLHTSIELLPQGVLRGTQDSISLRKFYAARA